MTGHVRRIPLSYRSHVTGFQGLPTGAIDYESALERDFVLLTLFDDPSARIRSQPVTLNFEHEGRHRRYTPDYLIEGGGRFELIEIWLLERWPDRMMILADVFGAAKRRWGIKCSHPEPIRRALHALPWPLARDLLWRMEGWDPSQDMRAIRMPSYPTARRSLRATRSPRDQGLFNGSIERPL